MSTTTSYRDRMKAAREALARYDAAVTEPDTDPGYHKRIDAALDTIEPLRALIEALVTDESPRDIGERKLADVLRDNV